MLYVTTTFQQYKFKEVNCKLNLTIEDYYYIVV